MELTDYIKIIGTSIAGMLAIIGALKKFLKKKAMPKKTWKDLHNNRIFSHFIEWKNIVIYEKDVADPLRRKMIARFLKITFIEWEKTLTAVINSKGHHNGCEKGCYILTDNSFMCFITNFMKQKYIALIKAGIPKVYIDRFDELYNAKIIQSNIESTEQILHNEGIDDIEKMNSILTFFNGTMSLKVDMAINTVQSINGVLTKALREKENEI